MARKFDLGAELRRAGVSNSDTAREQIEYLPLEKIDPDPNNFYSLEGIDELAANIETVGLQQPLRVRPGERGRYTLISGHRRCAACMMIRDGGSEQFKQGVPSIVERGVCSPEMTELRLIFANSSTRVMSSAELSRQMARTEELLYELMSQGFEFKGRMREHVAAALNTSSSKIGRLHAIRARLIPELLAEYDAGRVNESVAYRISQEAGEVQRELAAKLGQAVRILTADETENAIAQMKQPMETEDEETGSVGSDAEDDQPENVDENAAFRLIEKRAASLILGSFASGATRYRNENIDMLKLDHRGRGGCLDGVFYDADSQRYKIRGTDEETSHVLSWPVLYDYLCAIAITRYRQILIQNRAMSRQIQTAPRWQTGTPTETGYYVARLEFYGKPIASPRVLWWDEGIWYNAVGDDIRQHKIDAQISVLGWFRLPDEEVEP